MQGSVGWLYILGSPRVPWGHFDFSRGLQHTLGWHLRTSVAPSPPPPALLRGESSESEAQLSWEQLHTCSSPASTKSQVTCKGSEARQTMFKSCLLILTAV